MSKTITIASTVISIFLLTLLTIGLQINEYPLFAQESEIETVNATSGANTTASQTDAAAASDSETDNDAASDSQMSATTNSAEMNNTQQGNVTGAATTTQANATKEKPDAATISIGKSFSQQGTLTSIQDPLPGHEAHQLALILPPRDDKAIYQGTLTYTASKPTEVVILQNYANDTNVDNAYYGSVANAPLGEGLVAISLLTPEYGGPIVSASIPFAGNALALHNIEGEPFAATYTVSGDVSEPQTYNSITPPPATETAQGSGTSGSDDKDGDGGDNKDGDGGDNKDGDGGDNKDGDGGDNKDGDGGDDNN